MTRLFVSLYLGTLGTIFAFFYIAYLITTYMIIDVENIIEAEAFSAEVELVEQLAAYVGKENRTTLIAKIADRNQLLIEQVEPKTIPTHILAALENSYVWVDDEEYDYFRVFDPVQYYRMIENEESELIQITTKVNQTIFFTLPAFVAILCFLWLFGLHHKLKKIETTLNKIGEGDLTARASTSRFMQVGKLNQQLNDMADKIQHLLSSHKRLTHTIAHELRSPLFRMQMRLDLISDGASAKQSKYIGELESDTFELQELVDELLDYAKMERAEIQLKRTKIKANEFFRSIIEKIQNQSLSNIAFNTDLADDTAMSADPALLNRCVSNLIRNAERYGKGEVVISLATNSTRITFSVEDNGAGIDEGEWSKVFEPFYRINQDNVTSGYGLGLAICQEIVLLHDGEINVGRSHLGGALFTVSILS